MKRSYEFLIQISWFLFLICLPITSFPLFSKLLGSTSVALLSFVFLALLSLFWLLPQIIQTRSLPQHALPILAFFSFALLSTLLAAFLPIPSLKNLSHWSNSAEAVITLGIGISTYLLVSLFINSSAHLKKFVQIINITGIAILAYSFVQAAFWFLTGTYPEFLRQFQGLVSSSQMLYKARVTGFAFEPSWLAHQLNCLYMPLWLGMSLKKTSAYHWRIGKFSLENLLLVLGFFVLLLSFSRIGWISFIAVLAYLLLRGMRNLSQTIVQRIENKRTHAQNKTRQVLLYSGFWALFILIMLAVLLGAGLIFYRMDWRMQELFNLALIREEGILGWARKMIFAERLVYWIAGFKVFLKYPFFGVGLGNAGYFFPQTFNAFSYQLVEVTQILIHEGFIPNAKNLWVRILAETGIIGFSFIAAWLYIHWKSARYLERSGSGFNAAFGLIGQVFLIALIFEGFSIDSFALPYYWVSMGLIAAVFRLEFAVSDHKGPTKCV